MDTVNSVVRATKEGVQRRGWGISVIVSTLKKRQNYFFIMIPLESRISRALSNRLFMRWVGSAY